jgi:hypothetical protein
VAVRGLRAGESVPTPQPAGPAKGVVSLEAGKRPPEFKKTSRVPPFSFVNHTKTRKMIAGHFLATKSRTCAEVPQREMVDLLHGSKGSRMNRNKSNRGKGKEKRRSARDSRRSLQGTAGYTTNNGSFTVAPLQDVDRPRVGRVSIDTRSGEHLQ